MKFSVVINQFNVETKRVSFLDDWLEIGRGRSSNHITLKSNNISPRHCRMTVHANSELVVEDLRSTNGTYVNGYKINRQVILAVGDLLCVGPVSMMIERDASGRYILNILLPSGLQSILRPSVVKHIGSPVYELHDDSQRALPSNDLHIQAFWDQQNASLSELESPSRTPPVSPPSIRPIWVLILHPKGRSTVHTFAREEIICGRKSLYETSSLDAHTEIDVELPTHPIQHKHLRIAQKGGRLIVTDLKTNHGTYLNGAPLLGSKVFTVRDAIVVNELIIHVGFL